MLNPYNISTLYVSQNSGYDHDAGFYPDVNENKTGPLKTIEKALEKVAKMRLAQAIQPVTVKILDEEYTVDKTIVIEDDVSSVTIEPLTKTLVSGGVKLSGFKDDIFNGVKCFSTSVPEGLSFTDFYVDGARAQFTRYPETGCLKPKSVENDSSELHASSKWFIADRSDLDAIKNFQNFDDCFISYNHYWVDEHTPIESYDMESGKIVFKYPSRFSISPFLPESAMEYIIENVAEAFKNPNEWYFDRPNGKVYYIPRDGGQTAENIQAYAPVVEKLFEIRGKSGLRVENIHFRNLEFAYTKGDRGGAEYASDDQSACNSPGTIEFEFAHGCSVEGCGVRNFGHYGIVVGGGCSCVRIRRSTFTDGGAGGIKVSGAPIGGDTADNTFGIEISDNHITECGRRYFAACGILIMHSFDNTVARNEISRLYYTGISCGWVWGYAKSSTYNNLIEKNYIHHLGQGVLSDMGGIYTLGPQPGTVIRDNVIHDVEGKHYGGGGLYADEGSSGITFENNVCYNIGSNCFHQHYGRMNVVRNNIFHLSRLTPVRLHGTDMHTNAIFERNIMVTDGQPVYEFGTDGDTSGCVYVLGSNNNILFDKSEDTVTVTQIGEKKFDLAEAQQCFGIEIDSVVENPMLEDKENILYVKRL